MSRLTDKCWKFIPYPVLEGYRRKEVVLILDTQKPGPELLLFLKEKLEPEVRVIQAMTRDYGG